MSAVRLEIPEETLISLKTDAESFASELKMLAAVKPSAGQACILSSSALFPHHRGGDRHPPSQLQLQVLLPAPEQDRNVCDVKR